MSIDRDDVPERLEGSEYNAFERFVAIVRILRKECPWDREQTHESVKHLLIEEAYEAVEAIDREDRDELEKELGDVLLHVAFHAVIAEEEERFDLEGVIRHETEKLIRRHPHVFGDRRLDDADEVVANWEKIKQEEKDDVEESSSALDGVPRELPALLRAHRVQEKAAGVGFDFPERTEAWEKVREEIEELREVLEDESVTERRREEEFGDLLFALVNYARFVGVNPENALRTTVDTFTRRFRHVERRLADREVRPEEADLTTMDRYWREAKRLEG